MKNTFTFLIVLLFFGQLLFAQGSAEKSIRGQILLDSIPIEGVNITNTASKINAVSDQYGNFSILAREGNILSFSATEFEPLRKFVNKQEFNLGNIILQMTPLSIELKEVIVNAHPEITAENLGIIPRGQVRLTPAVRKLQAGSSGIVGVMNVLNGELRNLKTNVEIEKKEILMYKLEYFFDDKYYIETLKIAENQIKGFQYYCVEDIDFDNALNAKNKTMCMFLIVGLALKYNKNQTANEGNK